MTNNSYHSGFVLGRKSASIFLVIFKNFSSAYILKSNTAYFSVGLLWATCLRIRRGEKKRRSPKQKIERTFVEICCFLGPVVVVGVLQVWFEAWSLLMGSSGPLHYTPQTAQRWQVTFVPCSVQGRDICEGLLNINTVMIWDVLIIEKTQRKKKKNQPRRQAAWVNMAVDFASSNSWSKKPLLCEKAFSVKWWDKVRGGRLVFWAAAPLQALKSCPHILSDPTEVRQSPFLQPWRSPSWVLCIAAFHWLEVGTLWPVFSDFLEQCTCCWYCAIPPVGRVWPQGLRCY